MKLAITAAPLPPAPLDYQGFIEKSKEFAKKLKLDWEDVEVRVYNGTRKRTFKDSKGKQYTLEKGGMFMVLEDDDEGDIYLFIEGMRLPFEPSQRVYDTLMETSKKTSKKTTTKVSKPALPKSDGPVDKASKNPFINTPFNFSKLREGYVDNAGDYYDYRKSLASSLNKQVRIGKYTLEYSTEWSQTMDAIYGYSVKDIGFDLSVTFDPLMKPNFRVSLFQNGALTFKDVDLNGIESTLDELSKKASKAKKPTASRDEIHAQIQEFFAKGKGKLIEVLTTDSNLSTVECRFWGKWQVPDDEEDDGDYDWEVLTPESKAELNRFVESLKKQHTDYYFFANEEEKNWINIQLTKRKV